MAKKKPTKTKSATNNSNILTPIAWTLSIVALMLTTLVGGYYLGYNSAKSEILQRDDSQKEQRLALLQKLEKSTSLSTKIEATPQEKNVNTRLKEVLKKETKSYISASHELDDETLANPPKIPIREPQRSNFKAKLAIIIDDVGTKSQVRAIKSLHLPLTMSFLPPSRGRPNTPKLAAQESNYMVHLPMEAKNFSAEEPYTLRVSDSQSDILQRVAQIKKLFPRVSYINNHTGSKFTADESAMNRLIYALNKSNIYFVDSRTTAETKAPKVVKNFGLNYIARDVFLDHHNDKEYILQQIKKAIEVAKEHGTAIAIGHPHKNTLRALYESKSLLKSDVELVYINRL